MLAENWSDLASNIGKKPMPPAKLSGFFTKKTKEGPWALECCAGKSKSFSKLVDDEYSAWAASKASAGFVGGADVAEEAKLKLSEIRSEKKRESATTGRDKALALLTSKKAKRTIDLNTVDRAVVVAAAATANSA